MLQKGLFTRHYMCMFFPDSQIRVPLISSCGTEGEEQLFDKKLSKEEKKAAAKAAREAKKKAKVRHIHRFPCSSLVHDRKLTNLLPLGETCNL